VSRGARSGHDPGDVRVTLPTLLTPAAIVVALYVAARPGEPAGARAAGVVAVVCLATGYAVWHARGQRLHDDAAILALLPAVPAAVWITVGALALAHGEAASRRLGLEVGPGIALVGLTATILGYHGRHDPRS